MDPKATVYRIWMILLLVSLVKSQHEMEMPCGSEGQLGPCQLDNSEDEGSGQLMEGFGEGGGEAGPESGNELGILGEIPCRSNSLCKRKGGFCINSFSFGHHCDVLDPRLCGGRRCSCCIKGECVSSWWCSIFGGRCMAKDQCHSFMNPMASLCPGTDCTCCRGRDWWCERFGGFCTFGACAGGLNGRMCSDGSNCCVPMVGVMDDVAVNASETPW